MASKGDGRFLDDGQSFKAVVDLLPEAEQVEYRSFGSLNLEAAFHGRKLVVYNLTEGGPAGVEIWHLGAFSVSPDNGPSCELELPSGEVVTIDVRPQKVRGRDVFVHMPQNFIMKWKGRPTKSGIKFGPHYAVLTKTRSKAHHQVIGHTYVETLNSFRDRFPEYALAY